MRDFIRPAQLIPESKRLNVLLQNFALIEIISISGG